MAKRNLEHAVTLETNYWRQSVVQKFSKAKKKKRFQLTLVRISCNKLKYIKYI